MHSSHTVTETKLVRTCVKSRSFELSERRKLCCTTSKYLVVLGITPQYATDCIYQQQTVTKPGYNSLHLTNLVQTITREQKPTADKRWGLKGHGKQPISYHSLSQQAGMLVSIRRHESKLIERGRMNVNYALLCMLWCVVLHSTAACFYCPVSAACCCCQGGTSITGL